MLKDRLYIVKNISAENNTVEAVVELNENHEIFKGHFPGQPILPGVCMMQMVKELLELSLLKKLQMIKTGEIKFLSMIVPAEKTLIHFSVPYNFAEESVLNINAKILKDEVLCCKMKASYNIK
ncbi:MAG: 3-hydroxyacyl-ACP dehydratase [Parafilimonas sp.]